MDMGLSVKVFKIQQDILPIVKDVNNFYNRKYFDINKIIAELRPLINKHGVIVMQPLTYTADGKPALATVLIDAETGAEYIQFTSVPETHDIQKFGANITYLRRYELQSIFLLEAEDDDGETSVGRGESQKQMSSTSAPSKSAPTRSTALLAVTPDPNWSSYKLTFGKHKGLTIGETPNDYLAFLAGSDIKKPDLAKALAGWSDAHVNKNDVMSQEQEGHMTDDGYQPAANGTREDDEVRLEDIPF